MNSPCHFSSCRPASRVIVAVALAIGVTVAPVSEASAANDSPVFGWELLESGGEADFAAIDMVNADVAWIGSFASGLVLTVDGGETFTDVTPPGFDPEWGSFVQDIEAWSAENAIIVVGPDADTTAIYRTSDGGQNWTEVYRATVPAFINCIAMFGRRHGLAMADPVDGKFQIIMTSDAGRTWDLAPVTMPDATEGEIGVATNGKCLTATGRNAFFGTWTPAGEPDKRPGPIDGELGRVFRSTDFGMTWEVSSTVVPCCVRSLDFRSGRLGLAFGGIWQEGQTNLATRTTDGGVTWEPVNEPALDTIHIDLAWWSDRRGDHRSGILGAKKTIFAVGIDSVVSRDRGKTWEQFDDSGEFFGIDCLKSTLDCWAVGSGGRIARLVVS